MFWSLVHSKPPRNKNQPRGRLWKPSLEVLEDRCLLDGYQFTTLDVPGSTLTWGQGINASGQIVGVYSVFGTTHGFLLTGGSYTTLDVPGATSTTAGGINASGQTVGDYVDAASRGHGFLLSGGSYTTLDVPGASETYANGINGSGQIVGSSLDSVGVHGFLLSGGGYTIIDVPGSQYTATFGINDTGQMVGEYIDAGGTTHGFLLSGGSYTTLDVPGATSTTAGGINTSGQIVGVYSIGVTTHGFLLSGASYTTLDVPGATSTVAAGINASGQIVGEYSVGATYHGFLASSGVSIDINDTTTTSDDITFFDPDRGAQTVRARVTNNGPEGDFDLQVTPATSATLDMTSVHLAISESAELTITPLAVSAAPNDVTIRALENGTEVGHGHLTIVNVTIPEHIRNQDTPVEMPDRIPPREPTPISVGIQPDLTGSGQFVTLATDNGGDDQNGTVTIDGSTSENLTAGGNIHVAGVTQTTPGHDGNVFLVVQVRGREAVASQPFSVSAIPINFRQDPDRPPEYGDLGRLTFHYLWDSDSGDLGHLDQVWLGEFVWYPTLLHGLLPQPPWRADMIDPSIVEAEGHAVGGSSPDTQSPPGNQLPFAGPAHNFPGFQLYGFHDYRTDNTPDDGSMSWRINLLPFVLEIHRYVENIGTPENPMWQYRITKPTIEGSLLTNTANLTEPPPAPPAPSGGAWRHRYLDGDLVLPVGLTPHPNAGLPFWGWTVYAEPSLVGALPYQTEDGYFLAVRNVQAGVGDPRPGQGARGRRSQGAVAAGVAEALPGDEFGGVTVLLEDGLRLK
jgi:hypothetical protein